MDSGMIDKIVGLAGITQTIETATSTVIITADGKSIKVEKSPLADLTAKCGTVAAFTEHIKRYLPVENTTVVVGPGGCSAKHDVGKEEKDGECVLPGYANDMLRIELPFFSADLPGPAKMTYEAFKLYLDQHVGHVFGVKDIANLQNGMVSEEDLLAALGTASVKNSDETIIAERGASFVVSVTASKGAEPAQSTITKYIGIDLRRGTREYHYSHVFRLYIAAEADNSVTFRLIHLGRDGVEDSFLSDALRDIKAALPDYHVIQGA